MRELPAKAVVAGEFCYIASNERGTFALTMEDLTDKKWSRHVAGRIVEWMQAGHTVERVSRDEGVKRLQAYTRLPKPEPLQTRPISEEKPHG